MDAPTRKQIVAALALLGVVEGGHHRDGYTVEALKSLIRSAGGFVKSDYSINSIVLNIMRGDR